MMSATEHPTKTPDTANGATSPRPRAELLARLLDPEQVIMFDGAMGTMLYARGVFINQCYDELVLRSPDLVREIVRHVADALMRESGLDGAIEHSRGSRTSRRA